jgi:hypothetical protein
LRRTRRLVVVIGAWASGAAALTLAATTAGALTLTLSSTWTARTAATRRARFFERLHLFGSEDPGELGFHFLLEVGDLLLLVVGEIEFVLHERRNQVHAAGRTAWATGTVVRPALASASITTTAISAIRRRAIGRIGSDRPADQNASQQSRQQ